MGNGIYNRMELILDRPFNLKHTLECGQFFRWEMIDNWYWVNTRDIYFRIKQEGNKLVYQSNEDFDIARFFRLDDDLERITDAISKDDTMKAAVNTYKGLRLIRQDPWECMISYIISARNNIPSIRRTIETLSRNYGTPIFLEERTSYSFPTPEQLSKASVEDLFKAGLSFRAKNAHPTIKKFAEEQIELFELIDKPYAEARKSLMEHMGIGGKVADCISLFSLEKMESFPVDVWIKRFMEKTYFNGEKTPIKKINKFAADYFREYAGYAQEYMYHYSRNPIAQRTTVTA